MDRINSFSRKVLNYPISYNEAVKKLEEFKALKSYSIPAQLISASVVTFAFASLLGGGIKDSAAALLIGLVAYVLNLIMQKAGYFLFLINFVLSFVCGLLSLLMSALIIDSNVYIIIISSVLLYLPGVAMTNGVRDLTVDDILSGLTHIGEALLPKLPESFFGSQV
ncbi:MAG: threonine/serine exporter family protein [Clostridiaceae bacterium]|nr:threonine/serine exporter family protein [Clostridiaceae bacterium]